VEPVLWHQACTVKDAQNHERFTRCHGTIAEAQLPQGHLGCRQRSHPAIGIFTLALACIAALAAPSRRHGCPCTHSTHHRKSKYEQCKCKVPRHRAVVVTRCKGAQGQVDRSMCTHNCNFKQHRGDFDNLPVEQVATSRLVRLVKADSRCRSQSRNAGVGLSRRSRSRVNFAVAQMTPTVTASSP
jgi:hypothetical protein